MNELDAYLNETEELTLLETLGTRLENGNSVVLYKIDTKDKTRQWDIRVVSNSVGSQGEAGIIFITTGLVDGKKFTQEIVITEGKNLGKANATTPYTQALSEATSKIEQQIRHGYVRNIEDVQASGTLGSGIMQPMLAQKHDPLGKQKGSKTLEKMKIKGKKIHVQPKLDGNRCLITIARKDDNVVTAAMYTRKGDLMPVQLQNVLKPLVDAYVDVTQDNPDAEPIVLDGELFSNEMSFNELNGHLKRKDSKDEKQLAKINYHLYDVMLDAPYDSRYNTIKEFAGASIKLIPSFEITATDENIKVKLEEFLAEGHEGLMIRTLDSGYENKRTWQLCKVKLFEDFEAKLLDLELDSMGRLGAFIMEMPQASKDRDGKAITTFKAGTTGMTHEEGLDIVKNKEKYIGSMCTVEFFGLSEYKVPRFPKMKQLNRLD